MTRVVERRQRVVVVQETVPHYRVDFFRALADRLDDIGIDLVVLAGQVTDRLDGGSTKWLVRVRTRTFMRLVWQSVVGHALHADLVIVEHSNRMLTNFLLLLLWAARRIPRFAYWGHGANLQGNPASLRERFKRENVRFAHWWFAYTAGSAARVVAAGHSPSRTTVVQNAVDTTHFRRVEPSVRKPNQCVFIGSIYPEKRISFLLDAADEISAVLRDFELIIAGRGQVSGVDVEARSSVRLVGDVYAEEKVELLRVSSLLLMPGLVGLVAVDSFAAECPIVTTDVPFHSPEFEYLVDGENARVLSADVTPKQYAESVIDLLMEPGVLKKLRAGCAASAALITLDAMVSNFQAGVESALAFPGR